MKKEFFFLKEIAIILISPHIERRKKTAGRQTNQFANTPLIEEGEPRDEETLKR
jgi:hypothetical protein